VQVQKKYIKQHIWVFVNALIENPCFDSQTKETMTLKQSSFGSTAVISANMKKDLIKCGIIDNVLSFAKARADIDLGKKTKTGKNKKLDVPKLEDANQAGKREAAQCTLVLAEGDSAKTLVIAGMSVVGRDYFGVFPLKGKLLNVREATEK
jgi:DNA topoisomerase-2